MMKLNQEFIENEGPLFRYVCQRFDDLAKKVDSVKRSILNDIDQKIKTVNTNIAAMTGAQVPVDLEKIRKTLDTVLPLTQLNDFLAFDAELSLSEDKRTALIGLFEYLTANCSSLASCMCKLFPAIFTKVVQSECSGQGTKKRGIPSKRSFKDTATYACFEVVMRNKFHDTNKLITKVGNWLARWSHREGRRKNRPNPMADPRAS
ncbi:uncharacterized protein [Fopius arisanus]|uniref:Uncharacterized protein n=1 Tax=Fopius arisanus TaxID=64838 RepID=A0A9R1U6W5_9HYME|nr:PREDICTED: uncharacterized protein LOC105270321 [Fopius arisanus]